MSRRENIMILIFRIDSSINAELPFVNDTDRRLRDPVMICIYGMREILFLARVRCTLAALRAPIDMP